MKLFFTSFFQIGLVAINTILLARGYVAGIFSASFLISWLWTANVKKIAFSTNRDRLIYSLGAGFGAVSGFYFLEGVL